MALSAIRRFSVFKIKGENQSKTERNSYKDIAKLFKALAKSVKIVKRKIFSISL